MPRNYTPALNPAGAGAREISERVNAILRGKINSIGTVTLQTSVATTTLVDPNIGLDSLIFFAPMSANAKAEGTPWFQIATQGQATLNHVNSATTGRTYGYLIVG